MHIFALARACVGAREGASVCACVRHTHTHTRITRTSNELTQIKKLN